jgi:hypothetical protein
MNQGHILGKKRNRLSRCHKRLASKEITADQRNRLSQRVSELELELAQKK